MVAAEPLTTTDDFKFGVDLTTPTQVLLDEDDGDYIGSLGVISNIALAALIQILFAEA